jgi:hypothetical protein
LGGERGSRALVKKGTSCTDELVFADAFGVTQVAFGKQPRIKSTLKATAPYGWISHDPSSKLALVDGRHQTTTFGEEGVALLNLPRLGLRTQLAGMRGPIALLPGGPTRVARLLPEGLVIYEVDGDQTHERRRLRFDQSVRLEPRRVGPVYDGPSFLGGRSPSWSSITPDTRGLLLVGPDGHFAALEEGVLRAGRLDLEADGDELWWSMSLDIHPAAPRGLALTNQTTWITLLDHAEGRAEILGVGRDGQARTESIEALGMPAIAEHHVLSQPASDRVVRSSLLDGSEESFDVGAYNEHPFEAPESEFYKGSAPPPPTRLPGEVRILGERSIFIPWHREQVIDLMTSTGLDRGLPPDSGPFRRGMLECLWRDNEALAPLRLEMRLGEFRILRKQRQCQMEIHFPPCPPTFAHVLACKTMGNLRDRFQLRTHGFSPSSIGLRGGPFSRPGTATLAETRDVLEWMRRADFTPLEVGWVHEAYDRTLGVRHEPEPAARPFDEFAERLWLRATLETLRAGGWSGVEPVTEWESTSVTPKLAAEAVEAMPSSSRPMHYRSVNLLACMLAHHFDRDALPALLDLLKISEGAHIREAGAPVVWLCHRHPDLREQTIAAIEDLETSGRANRSKSLVIRALSRGARRLM